MSKDSIKNHFVKHKKVYLVTGIILGTGLIAGSTVLLMRHYKLVLTIGKVPPVIMNEGSKAAIGTNATFIDKSKVVNVLERTGRGHPGYMIRDTQTGFVYESQAQAAHDLRLSQSQLSNHLNGRTPHVMGHTFERLMMAA